MDFGLPGGSLVWLILLLAATLAILFCQSFKPHMLLVSPNGSLGLSKAASNQILDRLTGSWGTLNWVGGETVSRSMGVTSLLGTILSPELLLKIYAPMTLFLVGFSAWVFFRSLQFSPMVCVLGGLGAGLNMHFFSIACWGAGNWNIGAAMMFLAMGALSTKSIRQTWAKVILAGLAVGMGLIEAYDVGAILSVYVGVFVVFHALSEEAPLPGKAMTAAWSEALVIFFALFIAAHTISSLIDTQIQGVSAMKQDAETKEARWNPATEWSLPKLETLEIVVPGLFGYRLSGSIPGTTKAEAYWGQIGQSLRIPEMESTDPKVRAKAIEKLQLPDSYLTALNSPDQATRVAGIDAVTRKAGLYWRYNEHGECAGIMVLLLALFAVANLWRKVSPWSPPERRAVVFWGLIALFSLLAAWGRFAFLYRLLYCLPYVSTIRNPVKFLHPFHIALIILAAYGMEVLCRLYLRGGDSGNELLPHRLQFWRAKVTGFVRYWTIFLVVLAGLSIVGFAMLYARKSNLIQYLETQQFAPKDAPSIANFSVASAGVFLIYLALSIVVITGILSGALSGTRAKWAGVFLGALIVFDLVRADHPWVSYYDYTEKYALNPVVEFLLDKPWEHRVIGKLEPRGPGSGIQQGFGQLYFFWLQNDFPYRNIQALDFSQASHMPDLDRLYLKAFELKGADFQSTDLRPAVRLWQLTNTRYILASAYTLGGVTTADFLNQRADPIHRGFKMENFFTMRRKPGVQALGDIGDLTVQFAPKGELGIIENTRALPRAKLYSNWRTSTNDDATLETLASQEFEPWDTVLLATNSAVPQPDSTSTADPGAVEVTQYNPKYVKIEADAKNPCVLLLNDRWNSDWRVRVDGANRAVLRCNDIMRGVYLKPGHHIVQFRFQPSTMSLYISLCATVIGILLAAYLIIIRQPI
jgi:hypothetical protein